MNDRTTITSEFENDIDIAIEPEHTSSSKGRHTGSTWTGAAS